MKKFKFILIVFAISISITLNCYAKIGDSGYEGGISSGQNLSTSKNSNQFEYQEVVFITGKPIVLKGTVEVKEKVSKDLVTTTYDYDLSDTNNNSLSRNVIFETKITQKGNNQVIKETIISKTPTETIRVGGVEYVLDTYYTSRSTIADLRPAVDYFATNMNTRKTYYERNDTGHKVSVTIDGEIYGFEQSWSSAEAQILKYYVKSESAKDEWSGTATVKLSQTLNTQLKYISNFLEEISFAGGYVQSESVVSKLKYETNLPVFDAKGISTDKMSKKTGNVIMNSFPKEKRLVVRDLSSIRGHWAEEDINKLYSLEIFDEDPELFIPNQYISRAEFAKALSKAINNSSQQEVLEKGTKSPYLDITVDNKYFPYIYKLTQRKVLSGYEDGKFYPNEPITRVQAIEAFVKVLGLQGMSKEEYPITPFLDHNNIPQWSLRSVYAAQKIGFIKGDEGYLNPNKYLTKAESSALIVRFIDYMRETISKSYSDKILDYEIM